MGEYVIKDLRGTGYEGVGLIQLARIGSKVGICELSNEYSYSIKVRNLLASVVNINFSRNLAYFLLNKEHAFWLLRCRSVKLLYMFKIWLTDRYISVNFSNSSHQPWWWRQSQSPKYWFSTERWRGWMPVKTIANYAI